METEVGRGKVSENLALVIALWSRSHFLPEEMGGGRDLPGGSRTSWGHPKESTRDRDRSLGTPSPVVGSELGQEAEKMDPPPSHVRSKGRRDGP